MNADRIPEVELPRGRRLSGRGGGKARRLFLVDLFAVDK